MKVKVVLGLYPEETYGDGPIGNVFFGMVEWPMLVDDSREAADFSGTGIEPDYDGAGNRIVHTMEELEEWAASRFGEGNFSVFSTAVTPSAVEAANF